MRADPVLNKASILAKKRDYEGALKLLKDDEDRYYGSFKYYYLYGVICLYAGNYAEAHENFNLARKIKINEPSLMLGFAVLYLKRMNTVQAVNYYLEVQEMDPKNRTAKKALTVIRKYSAGEALSDWMTENISKLFPPIPAPVIQAKTIVNAAIIFTAALILTIGVLSAAKVLPNPFKRNQRPIAEFELSREERKEYSLSRDQAINHYNRALSLFTSYRDEAAKVYLNRIIESDASEGLKNRSRLLLNNMEVPTFTSFKKGDNFAYKDVENEPAIYRNVHVLWEGTARNVEITDEYTRFDLLVNHDNINFEGLVPVTFYSPVYVSIERPLEVLGRIVISSSYPIIRLEGVAIKQSARLE